MFGRDAMTIAQGLLSAMKPDCEHIEVAGSLRRGCQDVKDIEICAIPRFEGNGLFADIGTRTNLLHKWALAAEARGELQWIKPGTNEIEKWRPKEDGKYWRALILPQRIKLDLFLASPDNYGLIFTIRTGHKDFSAALLGYAKRFTPYQTERSYYEDRPELKGKPEGGYLVERATGRRVATPSERGLFDLLQVQWVEPRDRVDGSVIKPLVLRAPL
jgi:DNA polymerase/3'-5' exonuclease PolX